MGTFDVGIIQEVAYDPFYAMSRLFLDENSVVIDVGAHIGAFTIFAAARGARVIALEPVSENFQLLEENIRLNQLEGAVKPVKAALWSVDGMKEIRKPSPDEVNTGAGGFFYGDPKALVETVECISFQTLLAQEGIGKCTLLKMDCEGAEIEILSELPKEVFDKIDVIVLEYHLRRETDFEELLRALYTGDFLVDWEKRDASLGMLIGVKEAKFAEGVLQPLHSPFVVSPLIINSRISRLPILGPLEKRIRECFHRLVIFYLNQHLALMQRNLIYLRLVVRHMKCQGKFYS